MNQPMQPPPGQPMYYPPPPPKKSGVLKWVLIGCGGVTLLGLLACGGCFAVGYIAIDKMSEEPGRAGETYLRAQSDLESEIGKISEAKRDIWGGTSVHLTGNDGVARIAYKITAAKGTFSGTVYLERKSGVWVAVGATVNVNGKLWKVGTELTMPKSSSGGSWDD